MTLVEELLDRSEVLRKWWAEHKVQPLEPVHKLRLRILVPADAATRRALGSSRE